MLPKENLRVSISGDSSSTYSASNVKSAPSTLTNNPELLKGCEFRSRSDEERSPSMCLSNEKSTSELYAKKDEQKVKKVNKTNNTSQNKAKVNADSKTSYSAKGCENDSNVANTPAQNIPDSTKNKNSGNPVKDSGKVHKCPHCQQTCKKLFNLRRHISRYHGDIVTDNKEDETAPRRCTCLDCDFKCHKITDLRVHLQKAHGTIMN